MNPRILPGFPEVSKHPLLEAQRRLAEQATATSWVPRAVMSFANVKQFVALFAPSKSQVVAGLVAIMSVMIVRGLYFVLLATPSLHTWASTDAYFTLWLVLNARRTFLHGGAAAVTRLLRKRDRLGRTPLHYARSARVATLLLRYGADVNAVDCAGNTPLHCAVMWAHAKPSSLPSAPRRNNKALTETNRIDDASHDGYAVSVFARGWDAVVWILSLTWWTILTLLHLAASVVSPSNCTSANSTSSDTSLLSCMLSFVGVGAPHDDAAQEFALVRALVAAGADRQARNTAGRIPLHSLALQQLQQQQQSSAEGVISSGVSAASMENSLRIVVCLTADGDVEHELGVPETQAPTTTVAAPVSAAILPATTATSSADLVDARIIAALALRDVQGNTPFHLVRDAHSPIMLIASRTINSEHSWSASAGTTATTAAALLALLHAKNELGLTPLSAACVSGRAGVVAALLALEAAAFARATAVHASSSAGSSSSFPRASRIIDVVAPHVHDDSGLTPSHLATFILRVGAHMPPTVAASAAAAFSADSLDADAEAGDGECGVNLRVSPTSPVSTLLAVWRALAAGGHPVLLAPSSHLRLPFTMQCATATISAPLAAAVAGQPSLPVQLQQLQNKLRSASAGQPQHRMPSFSSSSSSARVGTTAVAAVVAPAVVSWKEVQAAQKAWLQLPATDPAAYAVQCDTLALSLGLGERAATPTPAHDLQQLPLPSLAQLLNGLMPLQHQRNSTAHPSKDRSAVASLLASAGCAGGSGCTPLGLLCAALGPSSSTLQKLLHVLKSAPLLPQSLPQPQAAAVPHTAVSATVVRDRSGVGTAGNTATPSTAAQSFPSSPPSSSPLPLVLHHPCYEPLLNALDGPRQACGASPGGALLLHLLAEYESYAGLYAGAAVARVGGSASRAVTFSSSSPPLFWYRGSPVDRGMGELHRLVLLKDVEGMHLLLDDASAWEDDNAAAAAAAAVAAAECAHNAGSDSHERDGAAAGANAAPIGDHLSSSHTAVHSDAGGGAAALLSSRSTPAISALQDAASTGAAGVVAAVAAASAAPHNLGDAHAAAVAAALATGVVPPSSCPYSKRMQNAASREATVATADGVINSSSGSNDIIGANPSGCTAATGGCIFARAMQGTSGNGGSSNNNHHPAGRPLGPSPYTRPACESFRWTLDVSAPDAQGLTPLHLAAYLGREEAVSALLSSGADTAVVGSFAPLTPLSLAFAALTHHAAALDAVGDDAIDAQFRVAEALLRAGSPLVQALALIHADPAAAAVNFELHPSLAVGAASATASSLPALITGVRLPSHIQLWASHPSFLAAVAGAAGADAGIVDGVRNSMLHVLLYARLHRTAETAVRVLLRRAAEAGARAVAAFHDGRGHGATTSPDAALDTAAGVASSSEVLQLRQSQHAGAADISPAQKKKQKRTKKVQNAVSTGAASSSSAAAATVPVQTSAPPVAGASRSSSAAAGDDSADAIEAAAIAAHLTPFLCARNVLLVPSLAPQPSGSGTGLRGSAIPVGRRAVGAAAATMSTTDWCGLACASGGVVAVPGHSVLALMAGSGDAALACLARDILPQLLWPPQGSKNSSSSSATPTSTTPATVPIIAPTYAQRFPLHDAAHRGDVDTVCALMHGVAERAKAAEVSASRHWPDVQLPQRQLLPSKVAVTPSKDPAASPKRTPPAATSPHTWHPTSLEEFDDCGMTPLGVAAAAGQLPSVLMLVLGRRAGSGGSSGRGGSKADTTAAVPNVRAVVDTSCLPIVCGHVCEQRPLTIAAAHGHAAIVAVLLALRANIYASAEVAVLDRCEFREDGGNDGDHHRNRYKGLPRLIPAPSTAEALTQWASSLSRSASNAGSLAAAVATAPLLKLAGLSSSPAHAPLRFVKTSADAIVCAAVGTNGGAAAARAALPAPAVDSTCAVPHLTAADADAGREDAGMGAANSSTSPRDAAAARVLKALLDHSAVGWSAAGGSSNNNGSGSSGASRLAIALSRRAKSMKAANAKAVAAAHERSTAHQLQGQGQGAQTSAAIVQRALRAGVAVLSASTARTASYATYLLHSSIARKWRTRANADDEDADISSSSSTFTDDDEACIASAHFGALSSSVGWASAYAARAGMRATCATLLGFETSLCTQAGPETLQHSASATDLHSIVSVSSECYVLTSRLPGRALRVSPLSLLGGRSSSSSNDNVSMIGREDLLCWLAAALPPSVVGPAGECVPLLLASGVCSACTGATALLLAEPSSNNREQGVGSETAVAPSARSSALWGVLEAVTARLGLRHMVTPASASTAQLRATMTAATAASASASALASRATPTARFLLRHSHRALLGYALVDDDAARLCAWIGWSNTSPSEQHAPGAGGADTAVTVRRGQALVRRSCDGLTLATAIRLGAPACALALCTEPDITDGDDDDDGGAAAISRSLQQGQQTRHQRLRLSFDATAHAWLIRTTGLSVPQLLVLGGVKQVAALLATGVLSLDGAFPVGCSAAAAAAEDLHSCTQLADEEGWAPAQRYRWELTASQVNAIVLAPAGGVSGAAAAAASAAAAAPQYVGDERECLGGAKRVMLPFKLPPMPHIPPHPAGTQGERAVVVSGSDGTTASDAAAAAVKTRPVAAATANCADESDDDECDEVAAISEGNYGNEDNDADKDSGGTSNNTMSDDLLTPGGGLRVDELDFYSDLDIEARFSHGGSSSSSSGGGGGRARAGLHRSSDPPDATAASAEMHWREQEQHAKAQLQAAIAGSTAASNQSSSSSSSSSSTSFLSSSAPAAAELLAASTTTAAAAAAAAAAATSAVHGGGALNPMSFLTGPGTAEGTLAHLAVHRPQLSSGDVGERFEVDALGRTVLYAPLAFIPAPQWVEVTVDEEDRGDAGVPRKGPVNAHVEVESTVLNNCAEASAVSKTEVNACSSSSRDGRDAVHVPAAETSPPSSHPASASAASTASTTTTSDAVSVAASSVSALSPASILTPSDGAGLHGSATAPAAALAPSNTNENSAATRTRWVLLAPTVRTVLEERGMAGAVAAELRAAQHRWEGVRKQLAHAK